MNDQPDQDDDIDLGAHLPCDLCGKCHDRDERIDFVTVNEEAKIVCHSCCFLLGVARDDLRRDTIAELKEAQANRDTENAHGDADDALCRLLSSLGYDDVVEAYQGVRKWYA